MRRRQRGLTWIEGLTALVGLLVVVAVAIPLWNTHQLRAQRRGVIDALTAVQAAQDHQFGAQARYAPLDQLGIAPPPGVNLRVDVAADALGYVATAHAVSTARVDARCAQMKMDQHGRRWAIAANGEDSTADCWDRK